MKSVTLAMLFAGSTLGAKFLWRYEPHGRARETHSRADEAPTTPRNEMDKTGPGHYATVNGLKMYYEVHGTG
jgi:hypothetical protein